MAAIKRFKDKAGNVLHKLAPFKYSIASPIAVTGIYMTLTALTGADYAQNTVNGLVSISLTSGGVVDAVRHYRHKY